MEEEEEEEEEGEDSEAVPPTFKPPNNDGRAAVIELELVMSLSSSWPLFTGSDLIF